jgi:tetratricopeptide (TPR) repeat protein
MRVVRTARSGLIVRIQLLWIGGSILGTIGWASHAVAQNGQPPVALRMIESSDPQVDNTAPASANAVPNASSDAKPPASFVLRSMDADRAPTAIPPATLDPAASAEKRPVELQKSISAAQRETPGGSPVRPGKTAGDGAIQPIPAQPNSGPVAIEPASFKGVGPGTTTVEELEKAWGKPKEVRHQGNNPLYLYSIEPFKRVEVVTDRGKVSSVLIRFDKAFPANLVVQQLDLARIRPVFVSNELGEILGQAFPERGVLLAFEPSPQPGKPSMNVSQIILESISAEPFVLRAETNMDSSATPSLNDLDQAIKLQPNNARAQWLRARLLVSMGDLEKALSSSSEAVRLEPENPQFCVTQAQVLGQLGRFREAIGEAEQALKTTDQRPHVKARALCLLGDLVASSPTPDYRKAIGYHMEAVKLADALASDPHPAIRLAAKEALIDAHLGAAHDIAWGNWKEKQKAVTRWLERATTLADDLIKNDEGSQVYRLRVATRALAACVGARGEVDPTPWAEDALRVGQALIASADDPSRKAQFRWDLGTALYDALQVYQIRGQHDTAMKYGELAIQYLEEGKAKKSASAGYLLGRIYFRMGAVYALRDQNHRTAVTWFEKAIPLLEKPLPPEATPDTGRHGETFVSMGVSYWETGQRQRALLLTQHGVTLMEQAVQRNLLDKSALPVAYSNLATMHRHLGQAESAERYESLAAQIKKSSQR